MLGAVNPSTKPAQLGRVNPAHVGARERVAGPSTKPDQLGRVNLACEPELVLAMLLQRSPTNLAG